MLPIASSPSRLVQPRSWPLNPRTATVSATVLLAHALVLRVVLEPALAPLPALAGESVVLASWVEEGLLRPAQTPSALPRPNPAPAPEPTLRTRPSMSRVAHAQPSEMALPSASAELGAPPPGQTKALATSSTEVAGQSTAHSATALAGVQVNPPSSDAEDLHNPPPAYPPMSRRLGEQGTVVVRVFVDLEGRATQALVARSSGHARLDSAALETTQRWRYRPGRRQGLAEAMWVNVPIRFVLD